MPLRRLSWLVCVALATSWPAFAASKKQCVTAEEASKLINKDVCVTAHIYDVVELPDEACRFTIVSLREDRDQVGELRKYRDMNVQVRGIVQPMHGRAGMVLSHARQFSGGPPKFRPNPMLARGFNAEQSRPPINDPNLRSQGAGRSFMNTRDQETRPAK
jgi:hypothetical protein